MRPSASKRRSVSQCMFPHNHTTRSASILMFLSFGSVILLLWNRPLPTKRLPRPVAPMKRLHTPDSQEGCQDAIPSWIWNLHRQEDRLYSQSGEDGITETLIQHIPPLLKQYVEFGTEQGTQCNTRILRDKHNWTGLLMDGSNEDATINLHKETISPYNIVDLFQKYNVPKQPDYLSEDTDYADYFIWKELLQANYRPRIVVGEINPNLLPTESATARSPTQGKIRFWENGNNYFGVSALALKRLWNRYGYLMVYCNFNQVNCWGVRTDLLADAVQNITYVQDCLWRKPLAYHRKIHKKDDKEQTYCWVDERGDIVPKCDYVASYTGVDFHPWAKKSDPTFGE